MAIRLTFYELPSYATRLYIGRNYVCSLSGDWGEIKDNDYWTIWYDCVGIRRDIAYQSQDDAPAFTLSDEFYDADELVSAMSMKMVFTIEYFHSETKTWATYTQEETIYIHPDALQPTIALPLVKDINSTTINLTGDDQKLIRYASTAQVQVRAYASAGAILNDRDVITTHAGKTYAAKTLTIPYIASREFKIQATDSRGLKTAITYTIPSERIIEYFRPTCVLSDNRPTTDGSMVVECSGAFFNDTFGAVYNSLIVRYRYKEKNADGFGAWNDMIVTTNGNSYTARATIDEGTFDYRNSYVFECSAIDKVSSVTSAEHTTITIPVFHWSSEDFVHETLVNFKAGIQINGEDMDYIEEQGTSGNWAYRKWHSGFAECWGRFSKTVYGSDWTAWGSLYQAEIISSEAYPFAFTEQQKEFATLHSTSGGMLNSTAWLMSTTQSGEHYAVHPNKLTSAYGFILELYVVGKWK